MPNFCMAKSSKTQKSNITDHPDLEGIRNSEYWIEINRVLSEAIAEHEDKVDAHDHVLILLSDLFTEYQELSKIIENEGRTYRKQTQYGYSINEHPCVSQRQRCLTTIRSYLALIGVSLRDLNASNPLQDDWD